MEKSNTPPDIAECIIQIVVPKCLQSRLLEIAHSIPAAGHLGVIIFVPKCLQSRLLEIAHSIPAAGHLGVI